MNKKGQFGMSWMVDFVSAIALVIVILTSVFIFMWSDIDAPEVAKIGSGVSDIKNTDILLGYLHFQVLYEENKVDMVQLIDLYANDKGAWKSFIEIQSPAFLQNTDYYISIYDQGDDIFGAKALHIASLKNDPKTKTIPNNKEKWISLTEIPIITSTDKVINIAIFSEKQ